jgi:acyl carrier protein
MTRDELRQLVLAIIADIAPDEDLSKIDDEKPLRDQIALDSMDFLDIVMELRKRHKVEVPEADYPQLRTMASTVAYLTPKMK